MIDWMLDFFLGLLNGRCVVCKRAIMYYKQEISGLGPGCGVDGGSITIHSACSKSFYADMINQEPYISRTKEYKEKIGWYKT